MKADGFKPLWRPLLVVAAVLFLVEEWAWEHLAAAMAYVARLRAVRAAERWFVQLPPWAVAMLVLTPLAVVEPAKLIGLYLMAMGQVTAGVVVIALSYLVGTAVVARLVRIGRPQLDRLPWIAAGLAWIEGWSARIHAAVRASAAYRWMKEMVLLLRGGSAPPG
jgi:hypothetical protein